VPWHETAFPFFLVVSNMHAGAMWREMSALVEIGHAI